jgi:hypothetical protein
VKNFVVVILVLFFVAAPVRCNESLLNSSFKTYSRAPDDVFMLSVAAINKNRFEILEMQSKSGYILFRAAMKDYLLSVSPVQNGSNVKIVPANSNFSGGLSVQNGIFAVLDTLNSSNRTLKRVP